MDSAGCGWLGRVGDVAVEECAGEGLLGTVLQDVAYAVFDPRNGDSQE